MLKLALASKRLKWFAFSRVLFYSTETATSATTTKKRDSLYSRISPIGDPRVSVVPILNQWINEGKTVSQDEMVSTIRDFRRYKRFTHALEISQWMSNQKYFVLSRDDIAVSVFLISQVHGIGQAEKYFNSIPKHCKVFITYFALLKCYTYGKSVEKAEALMQQMMKLGFAKSPGPYNLLLNLYSKVGDVEKLHTLVEEMNEKGVSPDNFTYRARLNAYADASNIDGMEMILQKMEVDPNVTMDWNCCVSAANGYVRARLIGKALKMLRKSEKLISWKHRSSPYGWKFLLTLYAALGRKDDVYRIWDRYKSASTKLYNTAYFSMISSLLKLDDIAGAEKILEEWESGNKWYDFRVPNLLIYAYCKNGLMEKAEMFVSKVIEKGKKPFANTWGILATGYVNDNQMAKAVEALKAGFLAGRPGLKNRDTLAACLVYLKQNADAEKGEEFIRLLGVPDYISIDDCERLVDYVYSKDTEVEMDGDGLDDDGITDEIA